MDCSVIHDIACYTATLWFVWSCAAFAELLDNALDEVCNGATFVNIDMTVNKTDASRRLLVEGRFSCGLVA